MQLPSIGLISEHALKVTRRFPLVVIIAIIGTISFNILIDDTSTKTTLEIFNKISLVSLLGLSLLTCIYLLFERSKVNLIHKHIYVALIALPILIIYYISFHIDSIDEIRLIFLLFVTYLSVMLSCPFNYKSQQDFWNFNKILIQRMVIAVLFTLVLYAGLSLALLALDKLFGIDVSAKAYGHLFGWIAGIFNTLFFLSGIPENIEDFNTKSYYPKGLKFFTQYILLPLASLYFVILYVYAITILAKWELPRGMVTGLTLAYSALGILSTLFIFPLASSMANKWLSLFRNWFYRSLFPLIFLMGFAIFRRVADYGITIERYLTIVATLWLFGIALYFTISRVKNIKLIPISLIIVGALMSYGPQNAFNISQNSQMKRLNTLLEKYKIMSPENKSTAIMVKGKDDSEIHSIVTYLARVHKSDKLYSILSTKSGIKTDSLRKIYPYNLSNLLLLEADYDKTLIAGEYNAYLENSEKQPVDISGFDHMYSYVYSENSRRTEIMSDKFRTSFDSSKQVLNIIYFSDPADTLIIDLNLMARTGSVKNQLSPNDATIKAENQYLKVKLLVSNCSGDARKMTYLNTKIFIKIK